MVRRMVWLSAVLGALASCGPREEAGLSSATAGSERNEMLAGAQDGATATAFVPIGNEFVEIPYRIVEGLAVYGGDMIVGSHEAVQKASAILRAAAERGVKASDLSSMIAGTLSANSSLSAETAVSKAALMDAVVGILGFGPIGKRWPTKTIPYKIDATITDATLNKRITDAIADWNATSLVIFKPEASVSDEIKKKTNVLIFKDAAGDKFSCSAYVGHQAMAAMQTVNLNPAWAGETGTGKDKHGGCSKGNIVHEIGHALGLNHEHMRDDRATYLDVEGSISDTDTNYGIIKSGEKHTPYDMCSIMHYGDEKDGAKWFKLTKTGQTEFDTCKATLGDTGAACTVVGQRCQISPRDLAAIKLRMSGAADP